MKRIKLFCLPYAGGSASIYLRWRAPLADIAEVIPIELAGRGRRIMDPYYNSFDDAVLEVIETIQFQAGNEPYALFGHSMGSLIVFEAIHGLLAKGIKVPMVSFMSGRSAPHQKKKRDSPIYLLPDDEFRNVIINLGGTSDTVFEDKDLYDLFVPILRNDYRIIETFENRTREALLPGKVCILYGLDDNTAEDNIEKWDDYAENSCVFKPIEGGHFFIHDRMNDVIQVIRDELVSTYRN